MKSWIAPVGLLVAALGTVALLQLRRGEPRTGFQAPDFTVSDLNGRLYRLSSLRGQVVFLNLWATWCPPCRAEMPSMERLHRRFRDRGLVVLAVSEDEEGAAAVAPFVRELGLTFPVLIDPENRVGPRFGVTGYPETIIIDRNGNVIRHFIGPEEWDRPESLAYFEQILAPPPP